MESVDDAPDRSEQADEGRDGGSDREPGNVALEARDFFGGTDLHATLNSGQVAQYAGRSGLPLEFFIAAFKDADERARLELVGDGGNILQALRLAKGADEASALGAGTAQQA